MKINGVTVRSPAKGGIVVTDEPIWSSNTGRATSGKMVGDIIAWKTTVDVTFPPLSFSESKKIRDTIKSAGKFFYIEYDDFGETVKKKVYVANIPRTLYSLVNGYKYHTDVKIQFVEQ